MFLSLKTRKKNNGKRNRRAGRGQSMEPLERRDLLTAQPIISEFVANNGDSLLDGEGDNPDWVEIFNAGDATAQLRDFYLSDNADDPDKWRFPIGTTLDAGEYLVVFASGLNEPDSSGNLHTNFKLGSNGEYISLSSADQTVSEFGENGADYPKQFRDVSYGIGDVVPAISLVTSGSDSQIHVPESNALGTTWTEADFVSTTLGPLVATELVTNRAMAERSCNSILTTMTTAANRVRRTRKMDGRDSRSAITDRALVASA